MYNLTKLKRMFSLIRKGMHHQKNRVSSFQALAVTIAGRVGAGNIEWCFVLIVGQLRDSYFGCDAGN